MTLTELRYILAFKDTGPAGEYQVADKHGVTILPLSAAAVFAVSTD